MIQADGILMRRRRPRLHRCRAERTDCLSIRLLITVLTGLLLLGRIALLLNWLLVLLLILLLLLILRLPAILNGLILSILRLLQGINGVWLTAIPIPPWGLLLARGDLHERLLRRPQPILLLGAQEEGQTEEHELRPDGKDDIQDVPVAFALLVRAEGIGEIDECRESSHVVDGTEKPEHGGGDDKIGGLEKL